MTWNNLSSNNPIHEKSDTFVSQTVSGNESDDSYRTIDDDDEYEPLSISGWGDNAKQEEPVSWDSLIDTSIKVKEGGIGSGNLHRRGGNFKPISEASILAQRLNKPIPGKKSGKKSRGKKKKSSTVTSKPPVRPAVFPRRVPAVHYVPPARERPANAPPSTWSQAPLVETPFWESKKPDTPAPNVPILCETPFWETKPAPVEKQPEEPNPEVPKPEKPTKWNVQVPGFQPSSTKKPFNPTVPSFNPSSPSFSVNAPVFNPNVASFNPTPTTASQSSPTLSSNSSTNTVFNTNVPEFLPFVKLATPKPVKISPALEALETQDSSTPKRNRLSHTTTYPLLLKQLQNINSGLTSKPKPNTVTEDMKNMRMESQTGPESTRGLEEPQPLVQIEIEFAPGITTELLIYENSKPEELAEDFCQKHKLNMTNTAKSNMANTIRLILQKKTETIG